MIYFKHHRGYAGFKQTAWGADGIICILGKKSFFEKFCIYPQKPIFFIRKRLKQRKEDMLFKKHYHDYE